MKRSDLFLILALLYLINANVTVGWISMMHTVAATVMAVMSFLPEPRNED